MVVKNGKGITLIALVITIILLLILAGVAIATLTGENGILSKASTAKEKHTIEQYKEDITLSIAEEIAERKTEKKEELMIVSLDNKIRKKEWVNEIYKCNGNGEEQETFETSTHLLVESKEHYEFLIEVNEAKETAKIVSSQKGTGEKYQITYNPNGGEGQEETIEIRQGFSATLKECNYTKDQYKFVGWSESQNGEGERFLGNSSYKPTRNITLYAIWELNVATITFNSNDGTNQTNSVNVTKGKETKLPENTFTRKGYKFLEWNTSADRTGTKYENGANITVEEDCVLYAIWQEPNTVADAKESGKVLSTTQNTTITDDFGNQVVVPAGFKIGSESAVNVTGGVVIEDVSHGATAGSEFVWIPVGKVYTDEAQTESKAKTINLSRYTFANDGTATAQGEKVITVNFKTEYGDTFPDLNVNFEEKAQSNLGNKVALNIEDFKMKANKNRGYYIGRYEARTVESTERTENKKDNGAGVTEKKDGFIYNFVTQPEAARLSQNMYSDSNFISDLVNSYAWDTAVVFLQTFDDRINKTKPYSRQYSLNTGNLSNKGTNNLTSIANQDKICNIWDMASNSGEWTTEFSTYLDRPCTARGGDYFSSVYYTVFRNGHNLDVNYNDLSFRPVLYM